MFKQLYYYFLSMRPKQRMKNIILFIPLVFSGMLLEVSLFLDVVIGFFVFSVFVGSSYILNDLRDIEHDKLHPKKKHRLLPAGKLNAKFALIMAIVLLIGMRLLSWHLFDRIIALLFGAYLLNTMIYTLAIKEMVILDVFSIGIGFVIRGLLGIFLIASDISVWLLMLLFFGALWLGFLKRYQEVELGISSRKNIKAYNAEFLKQVISMLTTLILIGYSFYTFNSVQSERMAITIPFVAYGLIRYDYNIFYLEKYADSIEDIILKDRSMLVDLVLYGLVVLVVVLWT